ncbi:MAG: hypothetical protein ACTHK1_08370 [Actinomycetales bacterium]
MLGRDPVLMLLLLGELALLLAGFAVAFAWRAAFRCRRWLQGRRRIRRRFLPNPPRRPAP